MGYHDISFVDGTNIQNILTDNADRLIDGLVSVDLVLFTVLLELVNLNLNAKKCHTEFWGNLQCCTVLYMEQCHWAIILWEFVHQYGGSFDILILLCPVNMTNLTRRINILKP